MTRGSPHRGVGGDGVAGGGYGCLWLCGLLGALYGLLGATPFWLFGGSFQQFWNIFDGIFGVLGVIFGVFILLGAVCGLLWEALSEVVLLHFLPGVGCRGSMWGSWFYRRYS